MTTTLSTIGKIVALDARDRTMAVQFDASPENWSIGQEVRVTNQDTELTELFEKNQKLPRKPIKAYLVVNKATNLESLLTDNSKRYQIFIDRQDAISRAKEWGWDDEWGMGWTDELGMTSMYKSGRFIDLEFIPIEINP